MDMPVEEPKSITPKEAKEQRRAERRQLLDDWLKERWTGIRVGHPPRSEAIG
jgi:hypothetical protein